LNQLGLTPQKPVWKAYQQKTEEVKRWLKKDFPAIRALAKNTGSFEALNLAEQRKVIHIFIHDDLR
jgi:short-subunit dehydrogenase involved in D-alanine esterification of teichoic acids